MRNNLQKNFLFKISIFSLGLVLIFWTGNFVFAQDVCWQNCKVYEGPYQYLEACCPEGGCTSITVGGVGSGCVSVPKFPTCENVDLTGSCVACADGSSACVYAHIDYWYDIAGGVYCANKGLGANLCECQKYGADNCAPIPPPPPPPPVSSCELQNLVCPATCEIGGTFDISYGYKKTSSEPLLDRQTRKLMFSSWVESYCESDAVDNNVWYSLETKTLSCDMDDVPLGVNVAVRCKARNAMAGMCTLGDQELTCNVQKVEPAIPPAIGYIRVKGPSGLTIELRVITDAKAISANRGVIKVRLPGGGVGAADLVPVNDVNASPVHVRTPLDVYSWRKKI